MKFWQLTSIFRDEKGIVENELNNVEWTTYQKFYRSLEFIVKNQDRNILDMQVDDRLLKEICIKSKKKVYGSIDNTVLYNYKNEDTDKEYTIAEAIEKFNHDTIEEIFEKSWSIALKKK